MEVIGGVSSVGCRPEVCTEPDAELVPVEVESVGGALFSSCGDREGGGGREVASEWSAWPVCGWGLGTWYPGCCTTGR